MGSFGPQQGFGLHPAQYWCRRCLALWQVPLQGCWQDNRDQVWVCRVCGARYVPAHAYGVEHWDRAARDAVMPLRRRIDNMAEHGRQLLLIAATMQRGRAGSPPLQALLEALSHARAFIHFVSVGISQIMLGMLKVAAQRVPVRGVVLGHVDEDIISELRDAEHDIPELAIEFWHHSPPRAPWPWHQTLVVIDGLLAFKGVVGAPQTSGWQALYAALQAITGIHEVIHLHNAYFSSLWGRMSSIGDQIVMDDIPFEAGVPRAATPPPHLFPQGETIPSPWSSLRASAGVRQYVHG